MLGGEAVTINFEVVNVTWWGSTLIFRQTYYPKTIEAVKHKKTNKYIIFEQTL